MALATKLFHDATCGAYVLAAGSNYYRPMFLVWLMLNSTLFGLDTALVAPQRAGRASGGDAALLLSGAAADGRSRWWRARPRCCSACIRRTWRRSPGSAAPRNRCSPSLPSRRYSAICGQRRASIGPAAVWRAASFVLFALALFTKETAIMLPLVLSA